MKTAPTNKKIRELIHLVKEEKLIPRPEFQRRLVWTHKDKNHFLDTIIRGYPFPEIYVADGEVDLESGEGTQLLVDGLQRISTILQYFDASSALRVLTVPPYKELDEEGKRAFLQYDVAVRDLGTVHKDEIIEVFQRINATKYSLLDIEVNNAIYAGELKQFAEKLAENRFFLDNRVFNAKDLKRMGDLRYALTIVITMLQGYFNRDDAFGELLDRYNDEFPKAGEMEDRLTKVFDFITECGLTPKSRIWRKAELFTAIIELDLLFQSDDPDIQPSDFVQRLSSFFEKIEESGIDSGGIPGVYYKAAIQATNDRVNRLRRGIIIAGVIRGREFAEIAKQLRDEKLLSN